MTVIFNQRKFIEFSIFHFAIPRNGTITRRFLSNHSNQNSIRLFPTTPEQNVKKCANPLRIHRNSIKFLLGISDYFPTKTKMAPISQ
jgi:hypothetical protein